MKIARLLEITTLLLSRGTLTASNLAKRFGVSTRTIYRDVEALSTAGVPIYMSKGNGGGISLLENYTLNKTLLSDQESGSILLALKTLQATQYPEIDKILDKMEAVFKNTQANDWVDIDFFYWGSHPNERNKFDAIKHAIVNRKVITFEYVNANGDRGSRAVEPLKLFYKGSSWYLVAYCRKRNSQRLFRISRIKNVVTTTESFIPKQLPDSEKEAMEKPPPMITFKLRFCDKVLNRLYDDFDDAYIVKKEDGTLEVEVAFPENEWLYGYLLSYGHFVEVLEPPHIRNILIERMKETLKMYEDSSHI
ncbi:helix-turn-helix transcriptional regulator [Sporomusa malonica]|uniref:Predicted DNA-binding transcriptional regulator YafY, contains an HTH and WYL domains n=1 Tax=Sporomusa malonica TaxID=112901 RepID=A0A1W2APP9_9FIRM|nr:YafY family protein [Sporomusa malonica]SMC62665.1 Predicted DNA-binding transcriptional regulator YafY, contains an HTH and WYL domains [Sporomusa malonica]